MSWLDILFQAQAPGGGGATGATIGAIPTGGAEVGPGGQSGMSVYQSLFNSPDFRGQSLQSALLGAASGLLKAAGPSTVPMGFAHALGSGLEGAQKGMDTQRDRFTKDLLLGSQLETAGLARDTQRGWMEFIRQLQGGGVPAGGAAPAGGGGGAMPRDYYAGVAADESGNDPRITNPSGAAGLFQFMPGTWAEMRRAIPGLPERAQDATPEQQMAAAQHFTQQNHSTMSRALGRAPTGGELRLAHYFGAGGASALLGLDPNTPFERVPDGMLGAPTATVIAQNPNLRGQTVGGLLRQYRQRFDQFNPVGGGPQTAQAPAAPAAPRPQAPTGTGLSIPRVTSPDQVATLAPGTTFIAPDGSVRVR